MPEQIPQIPISFGFNPQDAQVLSQIAKDIDVIIKALDKMGGKNIVNPEDVKNVKTLVDRIEQLKRKEQEALGIVEKLTIQQKLWKAEVQAAATPAALAKAKTELQKVNAELTKAVGTTNTWGKALGSFQFKFNALGNMAAMVSAQLWQGVTKFIGGLANGFPIMKEFEKSFAAVDSILTKIQSREFGGILRQASIDTIRKYGLAVQDVNLALYDAISSNVQAGEAAQFLDSAAKLAVGGLTTLNDSVKGLASVNNAFGLSMQNTTEIAAGFFTAQKYGITYVDEMVESFGRMNAVAKISGATWQEMMASFSAITLAGLNTEETVTALRNVFNELLKPSKQSAEAIMALKSSIEGINIPMGAAELRAKGFTETMRELKKVYDTHPEALSKIFGNIRGLTGVLSLVGTQFDKFIDVLDELNDSGTNVENLMKAVGDQMNTTSAIVERRKSAWDAFWLSIDKGDGVLSNISKKWNQFVAGIAYDTQVLNGTMTSVQAKLAKMQMVDPMLEGAGVTDAYKVFGDLQMALEKGSISLEEAYAKLRSEMTKTNLIVKNDTEDLTARLEKTNGDWFQDTEFQDRLTAEIITNKAYYEQLVVLYGELYKLKGFNGTAPADVLAPALEYATMNAEALREELGKINRLIEEQTPEQIGSENDKQLRSERKILQDLIALYGDEKKAKEKSNNADRDAIKIINEKYEFLKAVASLQSESAEREVALARLTYEQRKEIANIEIKDAEQLNKTLLLYEAQFQKELLAIERRMRDKRADERYQAFRDEQDIAAVENETFLIAYEDNLLKQGVAAEDASRLVNQKRLEFTIDWAKKELEIIKALYGENSFQARLLAAEIDRMTAEMNSGGLNSSGKKSWLAEKLGITDQELNEIQRSLGELESSINEITDAYVRAAEERTNAIEEELRASEERENQLESDRDHEWERMKEGYANNYSLKQKELEDERKRQEKIKADKEKALREEERRKDIQIAIDTILTVTKLGLAAAEAIESGTKQGGIVGAILGLAAAASIIAGFISIQSDAKSSVKYKEGGYFELDGPGHDQGGIPLGRGREAEGGEGVSIYSRGATRKYNKEIRDFTKAANSGRLAAFSDLTRSLGGGQMPSATYILSDEYSRKLYDLQKKHFEKDDIKVVKISETRTMIISDGGRTVKYINHRDR